jgi:hypothetical protein
VAKATSPPRAERETFYTVKHGDSAGALLTRSWERKMATRLRILAVAGVLIAATSTGALAQYRCGPGYAFYNGVCTPVGSPGYSNPVSGAVNGEANGAANGYATGGPVGAVVGGAVGLATGTVAGTANAVSGTTAPPACPYGSHYYGGYCYPNR